MKFADPENRYVKEVFENNEYGFVGHYPTVIDIGANIGMFSFWIYDKADRIFAIEPALENITSMQETIKMNNLTKIIVTQAAISNETMPKKMLRNGDPKYGGWKLDENGDYTIPCFTLEEFMRGRDIPYADLVKIDVEGEEFNIFNTSGFPRERIGTIIGETHSNIDRAKFQKLIEWHGYRYYQIMGSYFLARKI